MYQAKMKKDLELIQENLKVLSKEVLLFQQEKAQLSSILVESTNDTVQNISNHLVIEHENIKEGEESNMMLNGPPVNTCQKCLATNVDPTENIQNASTCKEQDIPMNTKKPKKEGRENVTRRKERIIVLSPKSELNRKDLFHDKEKQRDHDKNIEVSSELESKNYLS
jgi:hypothetical protein